MSEAASKMQHPAIAQPATTRRRWLAHRDVWFLLIWFAVQGVVNLVIYPYLPRYSDPELNELAWRLRAVDRQYEERQVAPAVAQPTAAADVAVASKWTLPYRLMSPKTAGNERYPLLVFLHGAGERGHENLRQLQTLPAQMAQEEWKLRFPCYVVAPQCPPHLYWGTDEVRDRLVAMIDELLREFPAIDSRRIYLTGLSMGGHGSWMLAAHRPDLFAAVVPICGGGQVDEAAKLVKTPLWAFHGDADEVVPVAESRNMIEAIRKAGGKPHYTELKGVGHGSWSHAYSDTEGALAWMFSLALPPATP